MIKTILKHIVYEIALNTLFKSATYAFTMVKSNPYMIKNTHYWITIDASFELPPWPFSVASEVVIEGRTYYIFER